MTTSSLNASSVSLEVDGNPGRTWHAIAVEREVLYVLDSKPALAEQLVLACRRKESELLVLFAGLSLDDTVELQLRLSLALPDDPIATRFMRLAAPRRARLVAFLGDTNQGHTKETHE